MNIAVPAVLPSSREDFKGKLSFFSNASKVDRVQIDVVDGKFASPACWPYTAPRELAVMVAQTEMLPHTERITYEIDLMCVDAERAAREWLSLGATRLTFHAESVPDVSRLLATVHRHYGPGADFVTRLVSFGLALNLGSDLSLIEPSLDKVDYVQFMGIAKIGRQGQPLDERVFEKVRLFRARHPSIPVQIDGGVTLESAKKLLSLGVTNLIVGSAIQHAKDPVHALAVFESLKNPYGV